MGEDFSMYFDIIAVFAFLLGGGNLCRVHINKVYRKKTDWQFSIVTLLGFFVMLAAGLFKIGNPGGMQGDVSATGSLFANFLLVLQSLRLLMSHHSGQIDLSKKKI